MDFYIVKDSTQPKLKVQLVEGGGRYNASEFYEKLQNSNIYFTMSDMETGVKKIGKKPAECELKEETDFCEEEYLIVYQFNKKDTKKPGTYIGKFIIEFLDGSGELIAPIREELKIHVLEGSIKK